MNREAMKAAETLLDAKLITKEQFADFIIKSLNGHATLAIAAQQPQLLLQSITRTHMNIEQHQSIVDMFIIGHPIQVIADNMNVRHQIRLTPNAIKSIINKIKSGEKRRHGRYQSAEWQAAFDRWEIALKAVA